jgi:hypothetical protein
MSQGQPTFAPPPAPAPPVPVVTLPIQRVPVQDGASGLHYSGRIYMNDFIQSTENICKDMTASPDQIADVFPNGISRTDLPVDEKNKRISTSAIQTYVANLTNTGIIPGEIPDYNQQITADKAFYTSVQKEYCFYEVRYRAALQQFLTTVADPRGADSAIVQKQLSQVIALNARLNSLLEVIHAISNSRSQTVGKRDKEIVSVNSELQKKLSLLEQQRGFLESKNVHTRTQEEMMRFSKEKNSAMNNQIMLFVALNVVALGTVLTVYKSLGPGGA